MLKAAAIFLDSWYTYKFPEGLRDVMNFKLLLWQKRFCSPQLQLHLISHTHFLSIQHHQARVLTLVAAGAHSQCLLSSHAGNRLTKEGSVHLREVHFVRLLSTVLQDLDQTDIPPSLTSHVHLKEIIHPF